MLSFGVVPIPTLPSDVTRIRSTAARNVVPLAPAADVQKMTAPPAPDPVPRPPRMDKSAPAILVPEPSVPRKRPFAGLADDSPLPIKMLPALLIRIRSVPAVVIAVTSAAGKKRPLFVSPEVVSAGADAVPAESVVTPLTVSEVRVPTEVTLGWAAVDSVPPSVVVTAVWPVIVMISLIGM